MKIIFLLPSISTLFTGGNIYNKHIIRELSIDHNVITQIIKPTIQASFFNGIRHKNGDHGVFITDSLLLWNRELLENLNTFKNSFKNILIIHYLKCLEPQSALLPEAKEEFLLIQQFDAFITTSAFSKSRLIDHGISEHRVEVIRPGLSPMFRKRSHIKSNYPSKLLTVSSFFPGKGLTEIISVLENLSNSDWEWILVGEDKLDPDFRLTLNDRLNKSSIKEKTQIIGPVSIEKLRKFYKNSDIFLLPSRFETCSMVTMEAMAAGLPIIAFNTGGLSELVHDKLNGYLLSAFDEHKFSSSIQELLLNDDLRQKMAQESFQISATFPSWKESSNKFSGFLNKLNLAVNTD